MVARFNSINKLLVVLCDDKIVTETKAVQVKTGSGAGEKLWDALPGYNTIPDTDSIHSNMLID